MNEGKGGLFIFKDFLESLAGRGDHATGLDGLKDVAGMDQSPLYSVLVSFVSQQVLVEVVNLLVIQPQVHWTERPVSVTPA